MIPDIFVKIDHGLTDMTVNCTELKCHQASNYNLNSLMLSDYRNEITGKTLIGINTHGIELYW